MCKCNMCGGELNAYDEYANFHFQKHIGYGSALDGEYVDLRLCCECFDKAISTIISQCEINPIISPADVSTEVASYISSGIEGGENIES